MASRAERRQFSMETRMALVEDDLDAVAERFVAMDEHLAQAVDRLTDELKEVAETVKAEVKEFRTSLRNAVLSVITGGVLIILALIIENVTSGT